MAANSKSAITPARSALAAPAPQDNPLSAALAAYDPVKYNLATPITVLDQVPPMHRVSVRVVSVNPATETYPIPGKDKLGLGKTALDKIAAAAGIQWIPERSGQVDAWNSAHRVKYRATAQIRDFDGRTRVVFAEKEIDLSGEPGWPEEDLGSDTREFMRLAKKSDRDPWSQILQQRQHIHSLAESKAKLRCIRTALGLPIAMTRAEVAKPWVVPALVPDLDTSDPEIKRMVAASLIGAQTSLYGLPKAHTGAPAPAADPEPEPIDVSVFEEEPASLATAEPWEAEPVAEATPCPLPVRDAVISACPSGQELRYRTLHRINDLYGELVTARGETEADLLARKLATGIDWLVATMDELAVVGKGLKAELQGGGK